jgi:hypothetical protein
MESSTFQRVLEIIEALTAYGRREGISYSDC